ncbi:hypothetical protein LX32DRAFT_56445 [Colletotrichum zoysiae]|uniref:Uncharacterized protein n=1 Tax=Colletotrichum zoysiae TaxID=1216348 RepID=A0AAD9M514_9PEZI|nr:hypothetical protein LX32DRAFT_56445 [Colletotrichum zoysiae]
MVMHVCSCAQEIAGTVCMVYIIELEGGLRHAMNLQGKRSLRLASQPLHFCCGWLQNRKVREVIVVGVEIDKSIWSRRNFSGLKYTQTIWPNSIYPLRLAKVGT